MVIYLYCIGKGVWGCLKNYDFVRLIYSFCEKILLEIVFSQEMAVYIFDGCFMEFIDLFLFFVDEGVDFIFEVYLDIG